MSAWYINGVCLAKRLMKYIFVYVPYPPLFPWDVLRIPIVISLFIVPSPDYGMCLATTTLAVLLL